MARNSIKPSRKAMGLAMEIAELSKHGMSQRKIGLKLGFTQSTISGVMRTLANKPIGNPPSRPASDYIEPYHILNRSVRRLFSERHFRPASALRIGRVNY